MCLQCSPSHHPAGSDSTLSAICTICDIMYNYVLISKNLCNCWRLIWEIFANKSKRWCILKCTTSNKTRSWKLDLKEQWHNGSLSLMCCVRNHDQKKARSEVNIYLIKRRYCDLMCVVEKSSATVEWNSGEQEPETHSSKKRSVLINADS